MGEWKARPISAVPAGFARAAVAGSILFLLWLLGSTGISAAGAAQNPHGNYVADTNQCRSCHFTHAAESPRLISKGTVTELCYTCHDGSGSIFDTLSEFGSAPSATTSHHRVPEGSQSCSDCHNPHDGGKDAQGQQIHWPRLLDNPDGAHGGNAFCWSSSCHGQGYFPGNTSNPSNPNLAATGHDHPDLQPESGSGTGITCIKCHQGHGSTLTKLLQASITYSYDGGATSETTAPAGNTRSFCYACHRLRRSDAPATYNYDGRDVNELYGHGADCKTCHNPHGTANRHYLLHSYDDAYSNTRSKPYNGADYQACFTCHDEAALMDNVTKSTTGFYDRVTNRNLHYLHMATDHVVCAECHRPHGAVTVDNPAQAHRVGFVANTVGQSTIAGTGPVLNHDPGGISGGACALDCHGQDHDGGPDFTYDNGGMGGVESKGGSRCGQCHNAIFQSMLVGASSNYRHGLGGDDADYAGSAGPNCLSTCHVDHDRFSPAVDSTNRRANNLRPAGGPASVAPASSTNSDFDRADSANGGLCLSCHKTAQDDPAYTQPDGRTGTAAIDIPAYGASVHDYEANTLFSSDQSGVPFYVNCAKCHNDTLAKKYQNTSSSDNTRKFGVHGSSSPRLLTVFDLADPAAPVEEDLCLKCHTGTGDYYGLVMRAAAKTLGALFSKTYVHPIGATRGVHEDDPASDPIQSARHVECQDCHRPHAARSGTHAIGSSEAGPSLYGSPGVEPSYPAGAPAPDTLVDASSFSAVDSVTREYQLCFRCHSTRAYGTSPPMTGDYRGAAVPQTNTVAEFNPNVFSYHPVYAVGKNQPGQANPNFAQTFVNGWGPGSTMTCGDCHASDVKDDARGTHGSNVRFMLRRNETGAGTPAVFCYNCHSRDVYGDENYSPPNASYGRVRHPINSKHAVSTYLPDTGIWCNNCHGADRLGGLHGSNEGTGSSGGGNRNLGLRMMNGAAVTGLYIDPARPDRVTCYTVEACHAGGKSASFNYRY